LKNRKKHGKSLIGLCPFHKDKNASFSANLENGMYKCFACGAEGNFLTFYGNLHGIDTKDAYKAILERYHIEPETQTYTVEQYAAKKRLP
jgi:DNA primase